MEQRCLVDSILCLLTRDLISPAPKERRKGIYKTIAFKQILQISILDLLLIQSFAIIYFIWVFLIIVFNSINFPKTKLLGTNPMYLESVVFWRSSPITKYKES